MPTIYPYRSVEWWLQRLTLKLDKRRPDILRLLRYYTGDHPIPDAPPGAQAEYRSLLCKSRSNWMGLVVDAVAERMKVEGIRFAGQQEGDTDVWAKVWQANNLDAEAQLVQTEALWGRSSAMSVWPDGDGNPVVRGESPLQVVFDYNDGNWNDCAAVLKAYVGDDDLGYVTLYLPDLIYKWVTGNRIISSGNKVSSWRLVKRKVENEEWPLENVLETPPFVEYLSNPVGCVGRSEIDGGVTDIQDRINETTFNRMLAAQFAAFKQRWVTGLEIKYDPVTGEPVEPFRSAVDRLFQVEDPNAKFGQFDESDLNGYISSVEADIQHLAAVTRTPPHYLLGQSGAFPSGDSLKATETGLVAKVRRQHVYFGEAHEKMFRLSLKCLEDPRASDMQAEVIWRDPESRSVGELVDSLVKMATLGVPFEELWARWGASPDQQKEWRARLAAAGVSIAPPPAAP